MDRNKDWSQRVLLTGDRHWDNPHSDQAMQIRHMEEAKEENAPIIDIGDLFCCMQGKYDPRADKSCLRPEHRGEDGLTYFDSLVKTGTDFFAPYAKQFVCIATGNHEESIIKRQETNPLANMISHLNVNHGGNIGDPGFSGWVVFQFKAKSRTQPKVNLYIQHGFGGGGPVTRGVIQTNRRSVWLPDADILVSGHVHESWNLDITRLRLSQDDRIYHDRQTHIVVPTYKEPYKEGRRGWDVTRGAGPKPVGAKWLVFRYSRETQRIYWDVQEAV